MTHNDTELSMLISTTVGPLLYEYQKVALYKNKYSWNIVYYLHIHVWASN